MRKGCIVHQKKREKKGNASVILTVRVSRKIQEQYDALAAKSHYSRNELIFMALQYALDQLEFVPEAKEF